MACTWRGAASRESRIRAMLEDVIVGEVGDSKRLVDLMVLYVFCYPGDEYEENINQPMLTRQGETWNQKQTPLERDKTLII